MLDCPLSKGNQAPTTIIRNYKKPFLRTAEKVIGVKKYMQGAELKYVVVLSPEVVPSVKTQFSLGLMSVPNLRRQPVNYLFSSFAINCAVVGGKQID